jgi:deoxyribodipyrimidine photo-lyase
MTGTVQILWFKRDLRVHDHAALAQAALRGPVLPLYIVEPQLWAQPDMSARHWAFLSESLTELQSTLAALGQPLIIRVGDAVEMFESLGRELEIGGLWSHEETGNGWTFARDQRVARWAADKSITWHEPPQFGVIRRMKSRNGWAAAWDRMMALPQIDPSKSLPALPKLSSDPLPSAADLGLAVDASAGRQIGGRTAGLSLLDSFLNERGRDYRRQMSSPVHAETGGSRLSPYIAYGCLSLREITQATWAHQSALKQDADNPATRPWRASMNSFVGRLHWHCHFMQKLEDEPRLEFECLHRAYSKLRPSEVDQVRYDAWANGHTGLPFVDACMRSLIETGWINFRMRAMLMAVASYHLWLPWQETGLHLARLFTDYEPGIHWPQVQMQSGTTGINTARIYNPVKQGYDQDADGQFVRRWVPELAEVPDQFVHEPWLWEGASALLGKSYPDRIVDHLAAAKIAREKIWAVRKGDGFRETARSIVTKHGSRKGNTDRMPRSKRKEPSKQLTLFEGL